MEVFGSIIHLSLDLSLDLSRFSSARSIHLEGSSLPSCRAWFIGVNRIKVAISLGFWPLRGLLTICFTCGAAGFNYQDPGTLGTELFIKRSPAILISLGSRNLIYYYYA